jgi:hypothetical protein
MSRPLAILALALFMGDLAAAEETAPAAPPPAQHKLNVLFNFDGSAQIIRDATLVPATDVMNYDRSFSLGQKSELVRVDLTQADCSVNQAFKTMVVQMPKAGSLVAGVEEVKSTYPAGSPRAHCNGGSHKELIIYETPTKAGDDLIVLKMPGAQGVMDVGFRISVK